MSRRLGDDPLTRARSGRAKADTSAPVASDSGGQPGTAQLAVQPQTRPSYNDVFFERRAEAIAPPESVAPASPDAPEITEISEIPEIREVSSASTHTEVDTTPDVARGIEVPPAAPASTIEEVVSKLNASVVGSTPAPDAVPVVNAEPASPPAAEQAPEKSDSGLKPEPEKSGGFFKRLFGKFK